MVNDHERVGSSKLRGRLGIIIVPDKGTTRMATKLALELTAGGAEFLVRTPHLALYHATFNAVPVNVLADIISELDVLRNQVFRLEQVTVYGRKFLFWNVKNDKRLQLAHEKALKIARYVDRDTRPLATDEGLVLGNKERSNLRRYGYPLVGEAYLPHVTLAYNSTGFSFDKEVIAAVGWPLTVVSVTLARIGRYGNIAETVSTDTG